MSNQTKKTGFIRWNAIIPFTVFLALFILYFHFFFDSHLKSFLSWSGTKALGVEVNISEIRTSFWKASFKLNKLEITDAENPKLNSIVIKEIRYQMIWDALLRAKFVVHEAAVEGIEFGSPRRTIGWVKPPEPVKLQEGPSAVEKFAEETKDKALDKIQESNQDNVLANIASLLSGSNVQLEWEKIQETLESKKMAQDLESFVKNKKTEWESRLKSLPQGSDFQKIADEMKLIKTNNFSNPQELQKSLQDFDRLIKEADSKYKTLQQAYSDLSKDLDKINKDTRLLDEQIKADIKSLENKLKIPALDSQSLVKGLFKPYADKYLIQFEKYKNLAETYLPPNLISKGEPDISMQPRPRARGKTYEFGRPNSYPLFWVKQTIVSSQAGDSPYSGQLRGELRNLTSNQLIINQPTTFNLKGDFPAQNISGFELNALFDNRSAESLVELKSLISAYPVSEKTLASSPDVGLTLKSSVAKTSIEAQLIGLKKFKLGIENLFSNSKFEVTSKNKDAQAFLQNVFSGISALTLIAKISGDLPRFTTHLESNIGDELSRSFSEEINVKIEAAKKQIQTYVDSQIAEFRKKIEGESSQLKSQTEGKIKELQAQAETQKKSAESKIEQSKKDTENSARRKIEEEAKKAAEDLKKKLGF